MKYLLKNGRVFVNNEFQQKDILIHGDTLYQVSDSFSLPLNQIGYLSQFDPHEWYVPNSNKHKGYPTCVAFTTQVGFQLVT